MSLRIKGAVDLDGSGWEAGLKKMEGVTEHVTGHLKGMIVGAFGTAAIEEATRRTIEYGDKVVDTARRVGVGVEALQEFGFAARQNGADLETLTGFIEHLNSARIDPKKGKFFESLGIDSSDLKSMNVEAMMMKIGENVRGKSSQEVIGPLRQVGGRGAGELLPMLKDNLDEVRKHAEDAGAVMRTQTAVQLKLIKDEFSLMADIIRVKLGPAVVWLMETAMHFANKFMPGQGNFYSQMSSRGFGGGDWMKLLGLVTAGTVPGAGMAAMLDPHLLERFFTSGMASAQASKQFNDKEAAAIKARLAALVDGLNNPPKPEFEIPESKSKKEHLGSLIGRGGDSLLAVGNFLGAGKSIIEDLAHQQLDVLRSIDRKIGQSHSRSFADDNSMAIPLV